MHVTFTITETERASDRVRGAAALATSPEGREAVGNGVRKKVVSHLRGLGPNKRFPSASTGFYEEAAESVTAPELIEDGAQISITKLGMRQRLLGGVIRQNTPGKTFLTIPNEAYSYGRLAPEFGGLKFAYARNEEGYLVPALVATDLLILSGEKKRRRRKKGDAFGPLLPRSPLEVGDVAYWLVRQVNQNPDPSVLPTEEEMKAAAIEELQDFISASLNDPDAEVTFE